jgi:hypothetical protein
MRWTTTEWPPSTACPAPAGVHFHDLRHTGNTLAVSSGASTRELMHRMGHASMRAALIYQRATSERDQEIAAAMDERITGQTWCKSPKPKRGKRKATGDGGGPTASDAG